MAAPSTGHLPHEIRRHDLAGGRLRAQSRRLHHRRAEVVAFIGLGVAHRDRDAKPDGATGW
jgi:hypothetical protein